MVLDQHSQSLCQYVDVKESNEKDFSLILFSPADVSIQNWSKLKKTVHHHHLKPSPLPSLSVAAGWWKITGLERPIECHYDNEDHIRATDLPVFVLPGVIIAFLVFPGPACCPR